ncbi:hypothetical protein [Tautonia plasticadhaerens]|uniref:Uncharacterized protein n=1 Tax=Tautonia plasticadhaerens TaxID=2527974 RepID=A0A518H2U4_9BACT|nr:hypothetical protein [Tautonia plasticadhaerens]QDV35159.1 hypothetical protein ElP_30620 [Tautonia plasticadhaerens]
MNGRPVESPAASNGDGSAAALDSEVPGPAPGRVAEGPRDPGGSPELHRALAEVKGQAQFLLYLADQIEESLQQFAEEEADAAHSAFLCKVLSMYSGQLEVKYHNLGERVAETCQEVYLTVRERDAG